MRRWLAIPVAAIIAVAAGAITWTTAPTADAGAPPPTAFRFDVDCNTSSGGIQAVCILSQGTVTVDVVLTNNSGSAVDLGAFGFNLLAGPGGGTTIIPTVPGACDSSGFNCNPDFDPAGTVAPAANFACSPPAPNPDDPALGGPGQSASTIGCFSAGPGFTLANGASFVIARVTYTINADGVYALTIDQGSAYDVNFTELGTCAPVIGVDATCADAVIQVGASAATATPTNTFTPVPPTNTPTATCVVGQTCATATSEAYVTVTPTPGPETPTVPASGTTVPGTTPPPPPPPPPTGGTPPGGTTGGGRPGGSITLPDTGTNDGGSSNTWMFALAAVAVLGSAGLASGVWYSAAAARRRGED